MDYNNLDYFANQILQAQSQQTCDLRTKALQAKNPSLLSMQWFYTEQNLDSTSTNNVDVNEWKRYGQFTDILKEEEHKMKINYEKFKYEQYLSERGYEISEDESRDRMTDYYYKSWNPLIIRTVSKHYYIPGPDPETSPNKRKFYRAWNWYRNYYDGKHGQKTEITIENEHDISDPKWQKLVVNMYLSGDFDLQQALYTVAIACDRCRHALLFKYCKESDGYSEDSKEYKKNYSRCAFCNW